MRSPTLLPENSTRSIRHHRCKSPSPQLPTIGRTGPRDSALSLGARQGSMPVPKHDDLFDPLLRAIRSLGGSARVSEQEDAVASLLKLSEKDLAEIHRGNRTKFSYRLAWARNYLKRYGLLENSARGVWALTSEGLKRTSLDKAEVKRAVKDLERHPQTPLPAETEDEEASPPAWEDELLEILKAMPPPEFRAAVSASVERIRVHPRRGHRPQW